MGRITFLIGNGFDINSGLKSTYIDSYDGYIEQDSPSNTVRKFKEVIERDKETWADFEISMAQYACAFNNENEFVECVFDYLSYLTQYLLSEEEAFISQLNRDDAIKHNVISEFRYSIREIYETIPTKNAKNLIEGTLVKDDNGICCDFICFNYTKVLDLIAKWSFAPIGINKQGNVDFTLGNIIHIHGQLESDVVLGLDNEEQLEASFPLTSKGRRAFIKPLFNEEFDSNRQNNTKYIIRHSDVICIYGLELGNSDLTWREEISDWLLSNNRHQLIVYKYRYSKNNYRLIQEKMNDEEIYKEEFLHLLFGEDLDIYDKPELRGQIHIPVGVNVFNIKDAIEKGEKIANDKEALRERLQQ